MRNSDRSNMVGHRRSIAAERAASTTTPPPMETQHGRAGPAHGVPGVGLDAVGDADEYTAIGGPPRRSRSPTSPGGRACAGGSRGASRRPRPCRRGRHGTDTRKKISRQSSGAEHAADHQPARSRRPPATGSMPSAKAPLLGGEGIGEDRGGVGQQQRAADPADPHDDQPQRPAAPCIQVAASSTENTVKTAKPRLYTAGLAEHVAGEPPEADDEHGRHHEVAHDQPTAGTRRCPGEAGPCRRPGRCPGGR